MCATRRSYCHSSVLALKPVDVFQRKTCTFCNTSEFSCGRCECTSRCNPLHSPCVQPPEEPPVMNQRQSLELSSLIGLLVSWGSFSPFGERSSKPELSKQMLFSAGIEDTTSSLWTYRKKKKPVLPPPFPYPKHTRKPSLSLHPRRTDPHETSLC